MKQTIFLFLLLLQINFCWTQSIFYARANGDWNDNSAVTGTWSNASIGGAASGTVPGVLDSVVIGGGFNVTISSNSICNYLTIENTGTLTVGNSIGLEVISSFSCLSNGTLTHSGMGSNAYLHFKSGLNQLVVANGAMFNIDDIVIDALDTLTISGDGDINLTDDLNFIGNNSLVTNNLMGNLNLTGASASSLWFRPSSSGCTFINNGLINIDRYIYVQGANSSITNSGVINLTNAAYGIGMTSGDATGFLFNNLSGAILKSFCNTLITEVARLTLKSQLSLIEELLITFLLSV